MAATKETASGDWDMFCERIAPELKKLDVARDSVGMVNAELFMAAMTFVDNRRLDEEARTVGSLERELADLASLPASRRHWSVRNHKVPARSRSTLPRSRHSPGSCWTCFPMARHRP
jgi:hypothetical protein